MQRSAGIESDALRSAEPFRTTRHGSVGGDTKYRVVRRQRRGGRIQRAVGPDREMKRRDACRQRGESDCAAIGVHAKDRAGAIADKQRAIGREREPARDAEIGRERLGAAVRRHAVDRALEPARHVEPSLPIEGHRRRIDDARRKCLARAVGPYAKNGDRHLLTPRAAVGHVQIAVAIEHRIVDLVQTGRKRRRHLDERRLAGDTLDAHRNASALGQAGRNDDGDGRR